MDSLSSSKLISQVDFDRYAAAWLAFLDRASREPALVQVLFAPEAKQHRYQANVVFDVTTTITHLLSTPGIAEVQARYVLLPESKPSFRIVLYAVDGLGGRISAYYLGDATWYQAPADSETYADSLGDDLTHVDGPVPYNLIRGWVLDWQHAALHEQLAPSLFATAYGPLLGASISLGDMLSPLFTAGTFAGKTLQLNLGRKTYYPAYPESPDQPAHALGLVIRLYTGKNLSDPVTQLGGDKGGDEGGGPSYDMVKPNPPG